LVSKLLKKEVMRSSDIGKEVIKKELPLIPKSPGVYKMLNQKGDILYVGKAKNLPNRLKSYVSEKITLFELRECSLKLQN
jgi:excinuclease ABC subunit C